MSSIIKPPGADGVAFRQPKVSDAIVGNMPFKVVMDTDIGVGCVPPPQPDPFTGKVQLDFSRLINELNGMFVRQNAIARELLELRARVDELEGIAGASDASEEGGEVLR